MALAAEHFGQPVIPFIGIALQEASAKTVEELLGEGTAATGGISEQHDRWTWPAVAAVVGGDRPEVAFLRLAAPRIEYRRLGLIHEQPIRHGQVVAHVVRDRLEMEAGTTGPVAQCRPIKPDPLARIDLGLTVKRRVVAKFGDDHMRDSCLGRQPAGHDVLRCVRLHNGARAAATDVFRAACNQHAPLRRDHVEALADVLADLRHGATTARAKRACGLNDPFHARQMGRQAAAVAMRALIRIAPRSSLDNLLGSFLRRVQNALRDLHVFERQMILIWS